MGLSQDEKELFARAKKQGTFLGSLTKWTDTYDYYEMPDGKGVTVVKFAGNHPEKWSETMAWEFSTKELAKIKNRLGEHDSISKATGESN